MPSFPAKAEQLDFAALINDTSNAYWKTFENGLKETAKELGVSIDIHSLHSAADAEGQLNQCEAVLLKNPKVLLFAAVDSANLKSCLQRAGQKGTLLIDVDGNITGEQAEKMGIRVAFSVASNNYDLGKKAADYIGVQKGKVLVIEGASSSQPSLLRVRGFKENLGEGLEVVASQPADWDRLKAADIVDRVMTQHPDLSIIYAANDTMALGAAEALHAAGIKTVKVIGVDGSADAVKAIKEGRLTASVAQLPYLMAKEALEKGNRYLKDRKPILFNQYVPVVVLDKPVFERNDDPLLQYLH